LYGYQGGAAEYVRVPAKVLIKVPEGLSLREAALVEPTVPVVHGLERVRCRFDDRVAVIGTGTLGLMAVQIAKVMAARVDAIGIEEEQLALAAELGADRTLHPSEAEHDSYSVVLEASGAAPSAGLVPRLLQPGGRAALIGILNEPAPGYVPAFVSLKRLELYGILHGINNFEQTVDLFASGKANPSVLVDRVMPASKAAEAFELLLAGGRTRPKIMLEFAGEEA
jgi:threonine dehydrogenase-like Zn-dependent dehydrogenase